MRLNIINHTKSDSLFNYGMCVLCSSDQKQKGAWHRSGTDISYYQNNFKKESAGRSRFYYTLTFTYDFKQGETVYFAYCYPYTFTNLKSDLDAICNDPNRSAFI